MVEVSLPDLAVAAKGDEKTFSFSSSPNVALTLSSP